MNKKTKIFLGLAAIGGVAYLIWKNNNKNFSNAIGKGTITGRRATTLPTGSDCAPNSCCRYEGNCLSSAGGGLESVGTVITGWSGNTGGGGRGIIVANGENRCLVCPYSPGTSSGLPVQI